MSTTIAGIVTNGVVVPESPLSEGAHVEIHLSAAVEVPPELQEEFDAWERAAAESLALVERMAEEEQANETR